MQTRRSLFFFVVVFAVVAAIALPVFAAFTYPLSSTAIRDAYFMGSANNARTIEFLADYNHQFPQPASGSYVQEIGIDTPFTEVIRHSQNTLNYHAPDAVEEFTNKPLPFIVHVDIVLTTTYQPIPQANSPLWSQWVPDFWNDFKVQLNQDHDLAPTSVRGGPTYTYGWEDVPLVMGAHIQAIYDANKISADPVTIDVLTPDGQKVETTFNLSRLR